MEASYFDGSVTGRFRRIGIMIIARVVRLGLPSGLMNGQTRFTLRLGNSVACLEHWRDRGRNSSQNGVWPGKPWFLLAKLRGFQLDGLCPKCFETYRQELGFVVDLENPQWQQLEL